MKLPFCYLEHLDSLRLGQVKQLKSRGRFKTSGIYHSQQCYHSCLLHSEL